MPTRIILLLTIVFSSSIAAQPPVLSVSGGRETDAFFLGVQGPPGAVGVLATDLAPGPVSTPIGTLGVGLSPALLLLPFSLDVGGAFALPGLLPEASGLDGTTLHLQAAVVDPMLGPTLSNPDSVTVRAPRFFLVEETVPTPFGQPGLLRITAISLGQATPLWSLDLPGVSLFDEPLFSVRHDLILVSLRQSLFGPPTEVRALDAETGSLLFTLPGGGNLSLAPDESAFYVVVGSQIARASLPSGLPSGVFSPPLSVQGFRYLPVSASGGYFVAREGVFPVLYPVAMGGAVATFGVMETVSQAWAFGGRVLVTTWDQSQSAAGSDLKLHVVSIAGNSPVLGSPATLASLSFLMTGRWGAPNGHGDHMIDAGGALVLAMTDPLGTLLEVREGPLRVARSLMLPLINGVPSPLAEVVSNVTATQWAVRSPLMPAGEIHLVDAGTFTASPIPHFSVRYLNRIESDVLDELVILNDDPSTQRGMERLPVGMASTPTVFATVPSNLIGGPYPVALLNDRPRR